MKIHIVQQGDTLWKLSKKYDVNFEELKQVNSHLSNPDVIMPGMKIKIPTGGVPVKKQAVKKEQPIAVPQPKEAPKKEVIVTAPKEEVKMPAPPPPAPPVQPIQHQMTQEQHLHHMNMNFNVYKPMPAKPVPIQMPAPPKLPEMKELPKVEKPKPMPPKKELPKPPAKPIAEMPIAKPAPMAPPPGFQMQQQCYPVTGVMPGCAPMVPQGYPQYPSMAPAVPYGYQAPMGAPMMGAPMGGYPPMSPMQGFGQMAPQMPYQPPPQQVPFYPQAQFGMAPSVDMDFDDEDMPPTAPSGSMQVPPMQVPQGQYWGAPNFQGYGDITMQQPMMQQPQPMMPQAQPWGYQQQPMPQQFNPYDRQQFRYEDEEEED